MKEPSVLIPLVPEASQENFWGLVCCHCCHSSSWKWKSEKCHKSLLLHCKAPRVTAVHWGLAWMEGGTCRLGGGCSQRGRDRTQPWQTGGEPWAAELWGTFLYWLHLSGWLHSFYSKYLLTTDHVKDTLLGTLRGTGCRKHHSFPAKSF